MEPDVLCPVESSDGCPAPDMCLPECPLPGMRQAETFAPVCPELPETGLVCMAPNALCSVESSDGCPAPDMCLPECPLPGMRQAGPIAPVAPFAPVAPVAPFAPVAPVAPEVCPELPEPMVRMAPDVLCTVESSDGCPEPAMCLPACL